MTTAAAASTTSSTPDISNERTWQDAVCSLIDGHASHDGCFSSGELARALRLARPDFRFAVAELGEFVKDLFHQGAVEYTDRHGRVTPAVQVPRRTAGRSRTPAGTEVFVYAPTPVLGSAHEFEVEIPRPAFTPTALERQRFAAAVAQANAEMIASVHGDGRLCIPRRAFEELSHATGISIRGGDKVWVAIELPGKADAGASASVHVYLDPRDGCASYGLQSDRGRLRFTAPTNAPDFTPGARFDIEVQGDCLSITLEPLDG